MKTGPPPTTPGASLLQHRAEGQRSLYVPWHQAAVRRKGRSLRPLRLLLVFVLQSQTCIYRVIQPPCRSSLPLLQTGKLEVMPKAESSGTSEKHKAEEAEKEPQYVVTLPMSLLLGMVGL